MSLPKFEEDHKQYIYASPTNNVVNNANARYIKSLTGESKIYKAHTSENLPEKKYCGTAEVEIKEGAQIICTMNTNPEDKVGYRNGEVGICTKVQDDYINAEFIHDGRTYKKEIVRSTVQIKEPVLINGHIEYKDVGWFNQIDCRIAYALTVHKLQGKTLDSMYFCLGGWMPEGLAYVALSRLKSLDGLGLNRPLTMQDIKVNEESMEFLTR